MYPTGYAFGCELWAPFSEELGRWPILQLSLFLVNVWQIPCALAPNYATIVAFRILGGFSSAGGSVTLGIIADMFEPEVQGNAVAFVVLSSVGGSVLGPIIGAFQARYLSWRWNVRIERFPNYRVLLTLPLHTLVLAPAHLRRSDSAPALVHTGDQSFGAHDQGCQTATSGRRDERLCS